MPINSRAKGARIERELAQKLREVFSWSDARRSQQYTGVHGDADITVPSIPMVLIESKGVQNLNVHQAMGRAVEDAAKKGKVALLCHKKNRTDFLATVRLVDLPLLAEMIVASKNMRTAQREATSETTDTI